MPTPAKSNKRVTIAYGRTYNMGQFESMRIDVSEEYDVQGGDVEQEMLNAFGRLKEIVETQLQAIALEPTTDPRIEAEAAPQTPEPAKVAPVPAAPLAPAEPPGRVNPQAILYKMLNKAELPKPVYSRLCNLLRVTLRTQEVNPIADIYRVRPDVLTAFLIEERYLK